MEMSYEKDVVAWTNGQAVLLRAGKLSAIDIEHIAEEIEDVGKSQQRELASQMAVLLAHLLKWQFQPARRGSSWEATLKAQRLDVAYRLNEVPSLKPKLTDPAWMEVVWAKAVATATSETGLNLFPDTCSWPIDQLLTQGYYPE